jgi:hypothetical protein
MNDKERRMNSELWARFSVLCFVVTEEKFIHLTSFYIQILFLEQNSYLFEIVAPSAKSFQCAVENINKFSISRFASDISRETFRERHFARDISRETFRERHFERDISLQTFANGKRIGTLSMYTFKFQFFRQSKTKQNPFMAFQMNRRENWHKPNKFWEQISFKEEKVFIFAKTTNIA